MCLVPETKQRGSIRRAREVDRDLGAHGTLIQRLAPLEFVGDSHRLVLSSAILPPLAIGARERLLGGPLARGHGRLGQGWRLPVPGVCAHMLRRWRRGDKVELVKVVRRRVRRLRGWLRLCPVWRYVMFHPEGRGELGFWLILLLKAGRHRCDGLGSVRRLALWRHAICEL